MTNNLSPFCTANIADVADMADSDDLPDLRAPTFNHYGSYVVKKVRESFFFVNPRILEDFKNRLAMVVRNCWNPVVSPRNEFAPL